MNTHRNPVASATVVAAVLWLASAGPFAVAADTAPRTSVSPGVAEVEKLAKARIGDDTIIAFVAASTTPYRLTASDLISLKEQGVSDRVLEAMLARQKLSSEAPQGAAASVASAPAASQPVYAAPGQTVYPGGPSPVQAPATVIVQQPAPTVVQPVYYAPTVVPYYNTYYGSYYPYGYYGGYWGPSVSLSVGLGRGWGVGYGGYWGGYWGGYRGGYHGGYHGGGGVHVGVGFGGRGHR